MLEPHSPDDLVREALRVALFSSLSVAEIDPRRFYQRDVSDSLLEGSDSSRAADVEPVAGTLDPLASNLGLGHDESVEKDDTHEEYELVPQAETLDEASLRHG